MGPLHRQLSNTKVECLEVSLVQFAVMGGKRVDIAKGTGSWTSLFSKRARVGQLQQQPIAIDSNLVNDTFSVDADPGPSNRAPAKQVVADSQEPNSDEGNCKRLSLEHDSPALAYFALKYCS
jgi:hypothetical protein